MITPSSIEIGSFDNVRFFCGSSSICDSVTAMLASSKYPSLTGDLRFSRRQMMTIAIAAHRDIATRAPVSTNNQGNELECFVELEVVDENINRLPGTPNFSQ